MSRRKNMNNGIWKDKEVKDLFATIEEIKRKHKPIKDAFVLHAEKYKRKPNSVRNYYYHEIDNLNSDNERLKKLNINLKLHSKNEMKFFTPSEEQILMNKIDSDVKNGISVRRSCLNLSNGNVSLMLRYQNKYRNYIAKNKPKDDSKIVQFVKRDDKLSDSEIQALFMGIVRLVKKSAAQEILTESKLAINKVNIQLRKTLVNLSEKQSEIEKLKSEFLKLREENSKLMDDIVRLRSGKANELREKIFSKSIKIEAVH